MAGPPEDVNLRRASKQRLTPSVMSYKHPLPHSTCISVQALGRREKGIFPVPLAFRKSFEVLPIRLAEKRGSLMRGSGARRGRGGLNPVSALL